MGGAGYYIRRGDKVIGPADLAKLKEAVAAGTLLPTDQLAKDAAGPWTEAGRTTLFAGKPAVSAPVESVTQNPPTKAVATSVGYPVQEQTPQDPPIDDPPASGGKLAAIVHTTIVVFDSIGRGALVAGGTVVRSLSTRAKRRHELKLAKIQAEANHPQANGPITFASQMVQSTVVRVVNKHTGGCGCSGCAAVLLLILLGIAVLAIVAANSHHRLQGGKPNHHNGASTLQDSAGREERQNDL
jgi:hypothetical protein